MQHSTSSRKPSQQHALRFQCSDAPEFVVEKARVELGETQLSREKCLMELKQKIRDVEHLHCNTSPNFLMSFLRAKKFDTEAAFKQLKKYFKHKRKFASLYTGYTPKQCYDVMEGNSMLFLPYRSPDGCAIWVARLGAWDPKLSTFEEILRFGLLCQEFALQNPITQICGVVSILDLRGFSWSHLLKIPVSGTRCHIDATQDTFPLRHKGIHIIHHPRIFSYLFVVIRPLLKDKIRNRIYFHGDDLSSLHQHIPRHVLPAEFEGTQGPLTTEKFYTALLESEEIFKQHNEYGYV